jgi:hypothetical protein
MAEPMRLLIVSPPAVDGKRLREEVERRAGERPAEVQLIAPAVTESKLKAAMGDVDEAMGEASERLEETLEGLRGDRVTAEGMVGDADPLVATEDALGTFPADEVLIVTHAGDKAEWFEEDLFDRAAERFEPPLIHVELGANGAQPLAETEESSAGVSRDEPEEGELELSRNLPPFSRRDLLGIVVAIVGTIILALLAANVGHSSHGGGAGRISAHTFSDAARILIAIAFALINLAHVVGLVIFNSQEYRGQGRHFFANLSLFGTPIAIVVSLLLTI